MATANVAAQPYALKNNAQHGSELTAVTAQWFDFRSVLPVPEGEESFRSRPILVARDNEFDEFEVCRIRFQRIHENWDREAPTPPFIETSHREEKPLTRFSWCHLPPRTPEGLSGWIFSGDRMPATTTKICRTGFWFATEPITSSPWLRHATTD